MRTFLALIFALTLVPYSVHAYTSPGKPQGFVNDFAHVLSATDIASMEEKLRSLQQTTGTQVAVVTVPSLGDETVETYATALFQEWGIGVKGKDNGLLILVAPTEHEVRIEVGYGLEGTVTDLESGNVIRKVMIPAFKEDKYAEGIVGAVDAVSSIISGSPDAVQYSLPEPISRGSFPHINVNLIIFVGFLVLNVAARFLSKTKSWWLGGLIGAIVGTVIGLIFASVVVGIVSLIILTILGLLFDYLVSGRPPGSGGRGTGGFWPIFFGGGSGGSGSGSSFGGFGGGMSGGGGASGRW